MSRVKLLFDLDGTLTNPFIGITSCIQFALEKLDRDIPLSQNLSWCIGPPLDESFHSLLKTTDKQLVAEAIHLYRERFASIGLFENEVYPEVVPALRVLAEQGYSMCVATSKPTVFANRIIEHFNLSQYFSTVNGSELNGTRGDKASLIAHILEKNRLQPDEVLMIGDRKHDVLGASKNKVKAIAALWGFGSKEELLNAGAYRLAKNASELPQVVSEICIESGSKPSPPY